MRSRRILTVAVLSLSLISLEIVWTRIFSAEFFYTFAFLVLSLAVGGLGMGALCVRLFKIFNRIENLGFFLAFTGIAAFIGPPLVFQLGLDFSVLFFEWMMLGKLILTLLILGSTFFLGGITLTIIFKTNSDSIPVLYMGDLLGAGAGVFLSVIAMNHLGTPLTVLLTACPILILSFFELKTWKKIIPAIILLGVFIFSNNAESYLEIPREERAPVIYKHWDAMSKIKIYDFGEEYRGINIDNVANSGVNRFDGNWNYPDSLKFGFHIVEYLIQKTDSATFLSLGAGGGQDVFQALQAGATEVHAVEVNSHINELMLEGDLAAFSGYIYKDPRVIVISEDARAYVRRYRDKFNLIYSFSSNSFAALASGAFALAENYLYTTEAFIDYWNALSEDGFLLMEHQAFMPRLVNSAVDALYKCGLKDAKLHLAVYDLKSMRRKMLLLSKRPLTSEILANAWGSYPREDYRYAHLLYPAPDSLKNNLYNQMVIHGWKSTSDSAMVDISPSDDNRPFVAQMGLWKNLDFHKMDKIAGYSDWLGFPLSQLIVMIILGIVIVILVPLNLVPYFRAGEKLRTVPWLYFFVIGMAFMSVEIVLIQKYTLLIGPSIYSIITILFSLLISSGIGSRFTKKIDENIVFPAIIIWLILDITVSGSLIYWLGQSSLTCRIICSAILITPLGFFMGIPFPKAALRVGHLVDWGFAVNGTASILGSTLIVLVAFTLGINFALIVGLLLYLLAYLLIVHKSSW
jgi:predicted membrane-bound spermidine synthase